MPVPGAVTDPSTLRTSEVTVPVAGSTDLEAYLARPAAAGPHPGVIVIHEAFGLVEHTRDVARRFANIGFSALAPDLYTRVGAPDPSDMSSIFATMLSLADEAVVSDLEASAAHLRSLEDAGPKVGVIGFCSGGRQTLLFASRSQAVDAAIDCWGGFIDRASPDAVTTDARPVPVIDLVGGVTAPLLVAGGAEDQNPSPALLGTLLQRLGEAGRTATVKIFGGAGHAFFADYRPSYQEEAANELWLDVMSFFDRHLR